MQILQAQSGIFVSRVNRFSALVTIDGQTTLVHIPNSGRMRELFIPGAICYLARRDKIGRKTSYDLILITTEHQAHRDTPTRSNLLRQFQPAIYPPVLVSIDSRLPPVLVSEAIKERKLLPFQMFNTIRREIKFERSRLDLFIESSDSSCLIETKSVSLVKNGVGLFPDAPTSRGTRHLEDLITARQQGIRSAMIFVVQREDVQVFSPNAPADPEFYTALLKALVEGVEIYAYCCQVTTTGINIKAPLPVEW